MIWKIYQARNYVNETIICPNLLCLQTDHLISNAVQFSSTNWQIANKILFGDSNRKIKDAAFVKIYNCESDFNQKTFYPNILIFDFQLVLDVKWILQDLWWSSLNLLCLHLVRRKLQLVCSVSFCLLKKGNFIVFCIHQACFSMILDYMYEWY